MIEETQQPKIKGINYPVLTLTCTYTDLIEWIAKKYPFALIEDVELVERKTFDVYLPSESQLVWAKTESYNNDKLKKAYLHVLSFVRFEILNNNPLTLSSTYYGRPKERINNFIEWVEIKFGQAKELQVGAAKPKKPNAQINQRAMIWRDLNGWMKLGNVTPTPKDCITELKKKPAYKNKKISAKRMQLILNEGFDGKYKDILKNV